jgi:endonuclease/exonuclease/phosphatase family metal-dependent hydrolase
MWLIHPFLIGLLVVACSKDPAIPDTQNSYFNSRYQGYADTVLSVLTWNIHLGFSFIGDPDDKTQKGATPAQLQQVVNILRNAKADIILLQEVPRDRCNTELKRVLEAIADSLKFNYAYGAHGPNDVCGSRNGFWGNSTLSRCEIVFMENTSVQFVNKWRTRSLLRIDLQVSPTKTVSVFNLHLEGGDRSEMENTMKLVRASNFPVLFGGDFNREYGNPDLALEGFTDYFDTLSRGVDRIFGNIPIERRELVKIPKSDSVSDHPAFLLRLKFK